MLGLVAGAIAGLLLSLVHGGLVPRRGANQIGSGIAVWMIGLGLTSYFGRSAVGGRFRRPRAAGGTRVPDAPAFAAAILDQTHPTAPAGIALVIIAGVWLYRTRTGLNWRTVGESPDRTSARHPFDMGAARKPFWSAGLLSGLGGAILSVDYTQTWAQDISKGRGFVAVGLVIVARWNPYLVLPIVLLFGLSEAATLRLQATGLTLSPYLIGCLPYAVCLLCVIVVSIREGRIGGMPAELVSVFGRRS